MRGILCDGQRECVDARITPAHAGNTKFAVFAKILIRDHPRACGEYDNTVR